MKLFLLLTLCFSIFSSSSGNDIYKIKKNLQHTIRKLKQTEKQLDKIINKYEYCFTDSYSYDYDFNKFQRVNYNVYQHPSYPVIVDNSQSSQPLHEYNTRSLDVLHEHQTRDECPTGEKMNKYNNCIPVTCDSIRACLSTQTCIIKVGDVCNTSPCITYECLDN